MKVFKKPIPVKFQYILEPITVETLEGPVQAGPGQVLLTGPHDDKYPISKETFFAAYNVDDLLGVAYKKKIIVEAEQVFEPVEFTVSWSTCRLRGKPGDYVITGQDGSKWIVEENVFKDTYEIIEENQ